MRSAGLFRLFVAGYLVLFFAYLFLPLVFMVAAAFNASRFPTMLPWEGFTLQWFWGFDARGRPTGLFQDARMGAALLNSILIGLGVICLSVPLGLAGALLLTSLRSRWKGLLYAVLVSPILTPGVILGISTLIFWQRAFDLGGGLFLAVIGQSTFIASYCMLLFMARLERFDRTLEEAALDLGASHLQMVRRILLPYLRPAILSACLIAFLQSFENYNTTLFVIGAEDTLTINIATRVRLGLTPAVNAIGVLFIAATVLAAIGWALLRRRETVRRERPAAAPAPKLAPARA
ncbi:MAG: putrescine ABC transporter permease PotI [Geminicoccaceae bacterium]|nr:MAG: putrescine ABC transporter permease PotI [Geminicoccaceae bacterium]